MQIYLTSAQEREADKNAISFGLSSEVLMKRAGRALADEVQAVATARNAEKILLVCGTGNNAGDGYVAARELIARGYNVSVYSCEGEISIGCKREKKRYTGKFTRTISGDIIVDCIFGTGLNRKLQGEHASAVRKINQSSAYVIAADIPSGLNGDNGIVMGTAVKADLTVALGHIKLGCVFGDGVDYCGKIVVKDIGVAADESCAKAVEDEDVATFYKPRKRNTNKGDYGSACLVAGSEEYLGAAGLSISSALRSGCGYVHAVVPEKLKYSLAAAYPQCIYSAVPDLQADAIAIGMGVGCTQDSYNLLCALLKSYKGKLIIDGDGLNLLAKYGKDILPESKAEILLTPHIGEMARLCGVEKQAVLNDPFGVAKKFAAEYNVTVHLKNAVSITTNGKISTLSVRGTSALAKAGSGDLLAGLICGNAARGLSVFDAAVCSQYVLGCAAEVCSEEMYDGAVTAADLVNNLHVAIKRLTR
ncbi:MAG: NAD(P)H-hydrate dehydratase [Clostridia bacterium]|nr:NAD(P)H-hydrate dehydratase [Clostridia bacterium]